MNSSKSSAITEALKTQFRVAEYNPAALQRIALRTLSEIHNGEIEVIDADTPFGFAVQTCAVMTSAAIDEAESLNRRQYPVAAQTEEDLYLHMSDRDYINRFAMPSRARFKFIFDKDELLQKMVEDHDLKVRKIVIPRGTTVTIADTVFTLPYPIEIHQLIHGGIQILYDNNIPNPIQTLNTNIIEYQVRRTRDQELLSFEVDLVQVHAITHYADTNLITNVEEDLILNDSFYHLRAFIKRNNQWVELKTTHTDQIYDINELTVVLKVYRDRVNVKIPQIYHTRGMVDGQLRFDLYETKGDLNMDLNIYPPEVFETKFSADNFNVNNTRYSAPLKNFKTVIVFSESLTQGGNRAMTFQELRNAVVNNSIGAQVVPITPKQIQTSLQRQGYDIVTTVDNVTNRTLLATRQLPAPSDPRLITSAAASIESVLTTEKDLKKVDSVRKNLRQVTITPDTLFESKNGVTRILDTVKFESIRSQRPELLAKEVTVGNYFYTPFHYVLDFGRDEFSSRPYYMDKPQVLHKSFLSDNETTLMQVSIDEYEITRTRDGYRLIISVKSTQNFKELSDSEVFVQLAFKPKGENSYAYLEGKLEGLNDDDERVFSFDLSTNFHINKDDELYLNQFRMFTNERRDVPSALENDFEILFCAARQSNSTWRADSIDEKIGAYLIPVPVFGISNESVRIRFGYALKNLWSRSRSVITASDYLRYERDVPMLYEEDVYEVHPETGSAVRVVNGQVVYDVKHRKGEPVLDSEGRTRMKHRRGDVILDPSGKPTFNNEYELLRQLDIFMLEGAYWFATDSITNEYKREMMGSFITWIVDGLGDISKNLLEQTRIFFYPKSTIGQIDVMINNSLRTIINSGQRFNVRLYVSNIVHDNIELRKELTAATVRAISEELRNEIVSRSNIVTRLKQTYGDDVIAFEVEGLGGDREIETITVLDDAKRCSLRKRLVAQGDGSLFVEEDVTCEFIRHDKKELVR